MESLTAIGFLLGLVSVLAIVLAVANSRLKVYEDPRIDGVNDMLPGNNCGACGLPGCRAFAEKAVSGEINPSECPVSGLDAATEIADYLGVEMGESVKKVARLLCAGGTNVAVQMSEYAGHESCRSASAVGGGGKACRFGCLGFGDCKDVCTFDAITMGPTGLPGVAVDLCTSCGDCVDVQLKAPPFNSRKDRLSRIDLDCGRPLCKSLSCRGCGRNSIDPSSRLDQHSRLLVSLSTVVLLT